MFADLAPDRRRRPHQVTSLAREIAVVSIGVARGAVGVDGTETRRVGDGARAEGQKRYALALSS
jgi:hypothetical protein